MIKVCLESPYYNKDKKILQRNIAYAERCMLDSINRGEAPFVSHLLYTRVLKDDSISGEREKGICAAMAWLKVSDKVVVYCDYGITQGILDAMNYAHALNIEIEKRYILKGFNDGN